MAAESMRELIARASRLLGESAKSLKTREELLRALETDRAAPEAPQAPTLVTRDFFVKALQAK
jgi:hypothetical protein